MTGGLHAERMADGNADERCDAGLAGLRITSATEPPQPALVILQYRCRLAPPLGKRVSGVLKARLSSRLKLSRRPADPDSFAASYSAGVVAALRRPMPKREQVVISITRRQGGRS